MAFGFAGAGAGAANALEDILKEQMVRAQMLQRQREVAAQLALQTRQVEGVEADRATNRALQTRDRDLADQKYRDEQAQDATDRNIGLDASNVLAMPGMDNAAKAQELTSSVLRNPRASSAPGMLKTIEGLTRKPDRDPIADHRAIKQIDQEFEKPTAPAKPGVHVVGGNLVDDTGHVLFQAPEKPNPNGPDPAKAAETRAKILDAAKGLRDSAGRNAMTGMRGMSYGFGLSGADPVPGTDAASAKARYDTLKSLLTLENLGLLKGAMSDKDLLFLQSAGSSLNTSMKDDAFAAELDKIISKFENVPGAGGANPPADAPPKGKFTIIRKE